MNLRTHISRILVPILLLGALSLPVAAADTSASTLRLESTQGTVTVTNALGRELSIREGGRLYSGYEISTATGYAWISLDDDKVIKLDLNTVVTLKKNGSDIEILLESGSLFFDVQNPLEEDESLSIRTSTMYTGVRGTIGVVSASYEMETETQRHHQISTITLLEGKLDVVSKSEQSQDSVVTTIVAGEKAIITQVDSDSVEHVTTVESASAEEVLKDTPYVAVEVAADTTLEDRILETQPDVDLSDALSSASDALTQQETDADASASQAESQVESAVESLTDTDTSSSSNNFTYTGSGGSSSSSDPTYYTVTFIDDDKEETTASVEASTTATQPELPDSTTGAWYVGTTAYDFTTPVTGDLTLTWHGSEETLCTVSFTYQDSDFYTVVVWEGDTVALPLFSPALVGSWSYESDFIASGTTMTVIWLVD